MAATGIDGIARETGQTSGAFYAHFPSKADVFRDAVEAGFVRLIWQGSGAAVRQAADAGRMFLPGPISRRRGATPSDRAVFCRRLPTTPRRANGETHRLFGRQLTAAANELAKGCGEGDRAEDRALAILALCAGGIMLARAIPDQATSDRMLKACREAAAELIGEE